MNALPRGRDRAAVARAWWRSLQPDAATGRGGDRAALAELRRCATPEAAATVPAALDLARKLGIRDGADPGLRDALAAAIVLAHLRADDPGRHPARHLHEVLSPLRFARLLQADTADERITAFRRAAALADRALDVGRVAMAMLDWPRQRIPWAFEYHGTPAPTSPEPETIVEESPA